MLCGTIYVCRHDAYHNSSFPSCGMATSRCVLPTRRSTRSWLRFPGFAVYNNYLPEAALLTLLRHICAVNHYWVGLYVIVGFWDIYRIYIYKACYLVCFIAIYSYVKEHNVCYFEIMKMRDRMLQFKILGRGRQSFTIMIKRCGIRLVRLVLCDEETYWLTK